MKKHISIIQIAGYGFQNAKSGRVAAFFDEYLKLSAVSHQSGTELKDRQEMKDMLRG